MPKKTQITKSLKEPLETLPPYKPLPEIQLKNPETIKCFTHEKKRAILEILLTIPKTIMELSTELGWNPGTVKRHLEDLIAAGLVCFSHQIKNKFNITMKFYRATASTFKFEWIWPSH